MQIFLSQTMAAAANDKRHYMAKFNAQGVPIMIARENTDSFAHKVMEVPIEEWTGDVKALVIALGVVPQQRTYVLCEVRFSKEKAREMMQTIGEMSGPDMYHVIEKKTGNIVLNMWQRVFNGGQPGPLRNTMEYVLYDLATQKQIIPVSIRADTMTTDRVLQLVSAHTGCDLKRPTDVKKQIGLELFE
jgi:hypothetical protein